MTAKVACNYTVLRFLPYAETGEFVNIGVALACPDHHWFGHRMVTRRVERITDFFPELKQSKAAFIDGRKLFRAELDRVAALLNDGKDKQQLRFKDDARLFNQVFLNLVRPREEAFCFGQPRTVLAEDPKTELERLFDYHVERGFAQRPEYQETIMRRRLRRVFADWQVVGLTEHTFASDLCHAHFPFVRQLGARFVRAIHPLDLDKPETPQIVEHADQWKNRLQRLQDAAERPEHVLLVVRRPADGKRRDVCLRMCKELEDVRAVVLPAEDDAGIVDFARSA